MKEEKTVYVTRQSKMGILTGVDRVALDQPVHQSNLRNTLSAHIPIKL